MKDSRVALQKFWLILYCFTSQIPVKQSQDIATLSEKGVRHWFSLFRNNLPHQKELLEHIVQLDEAYFGGWRGRALLMGKQKGARKLAYQVFKTDTVSKIDAITFLREYVKPQSLLDTDGGSIYRGIEKHFPITHRAEQHIKFEFKNTSEIEGMFGVLRTFIRRMYHHVSDDKLEEYVCEFYFRFCRPEMFKSPNDYLKNTLRLVPSG